MFTGSAHPELGQAVADLLGVPLGQATTTHLPDSETYVKVDEVVRDKEVFFIQSCARPVNDSLMELLLYMDAFRRASAHAVSVVVTDTLPLAPEQRHPKIVTLSIAPLIAAVIERIYKRETISDKLVLT